MTKNEVYKIRKMTDRQFLHYFTEKLRRVHVTIDRKGRIHDASVCRKCKWVGRCNGVCKVLKWCNLCQKVKFTVDMCTDSISRTSPYGVCKSCRAKVNSYFCITSRIMK